MNRAKAALYISAADLKPGTALRGVSLAAAGLFLHIAALDQSFAERGTGGLSVRAIEAEHFCARSVLLDLLDEMESAGLVKIGAGGSVVVPMVRGRLAIGRARAASGAFGAKTTNARRAFYGFVSNRPAPMAGSLIKRTWEADPALRALFQNKFFAYRNWCEACATDSNARERIESFVLDAHD